MRHLSALFVLVLLAPPALAQTPPVNATTATQAPATHGGSFKSPDGAERGTLTLTATPDGVLLRVDVKGLTPGWHGLHFHEKGACADEKFASAGGHVHGDTPVTHGLLAIGHNDAGDLPNIYVAADGTGAAEVYSNLITAQTKDKRPAIFDADGTAVVIHSMADDYTSQPIGNAGPRVACAVIQ
ncbi:superoxide dismutase family protein [Asticcacaulis biprosthecium]|uniref:superoxide dismutase family protein n=1 Tax=Asticcacaulis biprosthecium TaxID=76891 RepID=UPI00030097A9|nr:superoxide dismutase family protein [Asticcacaulis biprosthecium]